MKEHDDPKAFPEHVRPYLQPVPEAPEESWQFLEVLAKAEEKDNPSADEE
ncbi:hypothetical protein [Longibacter salinarum]|nr:hypothetical protein [Longibacter salinarum]